MKNSVTISSSNLLYWVVIAVVNAFFIGILIFHKNVLVIIPVIPLITALIMLSRGTMRNENKIVQLNKELNEGQEGEE